MCTPQVALNLRAVPCLTTTGPTEEVITNLVCSFRCFSCAKRTVNTVALVHVSSVLSCRLLSVDIVQHSTCHRLHGVLDTTAGDVHGDGDGLVPRVPSLFQKKTNQHDS